MFKNLLKIKQPPHKIFIEELLKRDCNKPLLNDMIKNNKIDINYINEEGESFLHIALRAKRVDNALWLMSKNIKLDIKDNKDITPFDLAIEYQYHRVIRIILKNIKVDLNKKNEFGRTILQDSVILGDHEMAELLISHGADINIKNNKNRSVIYDALSYNNEDFINYLLDFDHIDLNTLDSERNSLFDHKSLDKNNQLAMKLIKRGADPTVIGKDGASFLCKCAFNNVFGLEVIDFAIKQGHNINAPATRAGDSLLTVLVDRSISLNKKEDEDERKILRYVIQELVLKGLNINVLTGDGESALFKAVRINDLMLTSLLIELKIDVNIQNNNKQTALEIAVFKDDKDFDIILELLKHKANPTLKNMDEKTIFEEINDKILKDDPASRTKEERYEEIQYIRILKDLLKYCKHDLNFLDSTGNPLFYKPLMYHNIPIFYLYTNKGLDIYKLNKDGHNIFFEYLVKVFEIGNEDIDMQGVLKILISSRVDHNTQDETGWTAISKVIATTPCNLTIFKKLIKVVKFDYTIADKLGRTPIHSAVWKNNIEVIKIINVIDSSVKNKPDHYGILPIVYAALLGSQELVLTFISLKSKITTDNCILPAAIKKFKPMLKNLDKLTTGIKSPEKLRDLNSVIEKIKSEFSDEQCNELLS